MTKVYHNTPELVIIEKLQPINDLGKNMQDRIIKIINGTRETIYQAHEIWMYSPSTHKFSSYKNRRGEVSLLTSFLADHGINIRCDVAELNISQPSLYCFVDDKDCFLFNLKF
jgi:hypothetical protein